MNKIAAYYRELLILLLFGVLRLSNLLSLPAFNDEGVYLNWGFLSLKLDYFYALFDAKTPVFLLAVGFIQKYLPNVDPLYSGRAVAVGFGLVTLIGVYFLGRLLWNKRVALTASLLYTIIPIFALYDRQILMESAVSAWIIWMLVWLVMLIKKRNITYDLALGVTIALGVLTKYSSLLFIAGVILTFVWLIFTSKHKKSWIFHFIFTLSISQLTLIGLYQEPEFWNSLLSTDRYGLMAGELATFPISIWASNVQRMIEIIFWQFSPVFSVLALVGVFLALFKTKTQRRSGVLIASLATLVLSILLLQRVNSRYIVSYLPVFTVFAAAGVYKIWTSSNLSKLAIGAGYGIASMFTILLVAAPTTFFNYLDTLTKTSERNAYLVHWTAGYATTQAINYITDQVEGDEHLMVIPTNDIGHPKDSVQSILRNHPQIVVTTIENIFPIEEQSGVDCIGNLQPVYYVGRLDEPPRGQPEWWTVEEKFYNVDKKSWLTVYTVNQECEGESINLMELRKDIHTFL